MKPLAAAIAVLLLSAHTASASHLRQASWYDDGPGFYGAVHSWRWGDTPYWVKVCRLDVRSRCVNVKIRDYMGNAHRAIDLSPAAFAKLAPLSRGVVGVSVSRIKPIKSRSIPLPATSTVDRHQWTWKAAMSPVQTLIFWTAALSIYVTIKRMFTRALTAHLEPHP